jgi:hypothetical protein
MDNLSPAMLYDPSAHGLASGSEDVWGPFLGPAAREQKQSAYKNKSTAKWNMPESYVNKSNDFTKDTMEDFMLTAQFDWWTERIMPWYKTDDIHMQWSEWENNAHYMGITPHQTMSKIVTQRRTIRRASIVRRGIAAEFENDFVKTTLGRTSFMASLAQMARSVQETANVEVLRALLHCHRYQQVYFRKSGILTDGDLDTYLQRKADRFMIAQKTTNGLEILNTLVDRDLEQYGGKANVWILGREVMDYCSLVPPEKIFYYLGGQEAVDRVNGRPQNGQAAAGTMGNIRSLQPERMIAGTPVFIAKSAHIDTVGHLSLLSRRTEIGVYNLQVDRCSDYSRYRTDGRTLRVYDNDIDKWSDIELAYAIENCGVFDDKGKLFNVFGLSARAASADGYAAQADQEYDFLSYVDPTDGHRKNIEYIGDMSVNFANAGNWENAGQTLLNALAHHDAHSAKKLLNKVDKLVASIKYQADGARTWADLKALAENANVGAGERDGARAAVELVTELANGIRNLVGADNLVFVNQPDPAEAFYTNFVLTGLSAARRGAAGNQPLMSSVDSTEKQARAEHKFLTEVLFNPIGDDYKAEYAPQFAAIAGQTDKPWTERAKLVRNLVVQIQAKDADVVKTLPSAVHVDKWFNQKYADFAAGHKERFGSAGGSAASVVQSDSGEVRYFAAGARLPAGFAPVNRNASSSSSSGINIESMPAFAIASQTQAAAAAGGPRRARLGAHLGGGAPGTRADESAEVLRKRDADARGSTAAGFLLSSAGPVLQRYNNISKHVKSIAEGSSALLIKWLAAIYLMSVFTRQRLVAFARAHVYVCIGLLHMRSHCTYQTRYGIKVAAGGEAGYTFFGHSDMQIEHEAARKVGMMHYTAYLSAVVLYPKNVYVVEDLFCEKYLGGMGVEFWSAAKYKNASDRRARSIICAPLPPNHKKLEQKIDIRGRWYTEQTMGLVTKERFDAPLYPGAGRIAQLFGLADVNRKSKQSASMCTKANFVCWQGVEYYRNQLTGQFDDYTPESGNMGNQVGPGCGLVRNGALKFLSDAIASKA